MENNYYFPQEIFHEILQRLPSKSLCRFLSVCKQWSELIKSQSFITSHLNQNLNTQKNIRLLVNKIDLYIFCTGDKFLFYPYKQQYMKLTKIFETPDSRLGCSDGRKQPLAYRIIGSCNGLVCLVSSTDDIILFNRSIQKFVSLPKFGTIRPNNKPRIAKLEVIFGFGINPVDNDFKIVGINTSPMDDDYSPIVEVYSLRTGRWRWIEINGFSFDFNAIIYSQAYMNGRCHWIGRRSGNFEWLLISFDMSDEMFREILLPKQLLSILLLDAENNYHFGLRLSSVYRKREYLAIVYMTRRIHKSDIYRVWVMNEYGVSESWTRLNDIDLHLLGIDHIDEFFKYYGGPTFMEMENIQLTCYDRQGGSGIPTKLNIFDLSTKLYAEKYVESLVLLESPRSM